MKTISVIIAPALIVGIMFWRLWGHDLHMDVNSSGESWYAETFSLQVKLLASVVVGLSASAMMAGYLGVRRALGKVHKNVSDGARTNDY